MSIWRLKISVQAWFWASSKILQPFYVLFPEILSCFRWVVSSQILYTYILPYIIFVQFYNFYICSTSLYALNNIWFLYYFYNLMFHFRSISRPMAHALPFKISVHGIYIFTYYTPTSYLLLIYDFDKAFISPPCFLNTAYLLLILLIFINISLC